MSTVYARILGKRLETLAPEVQALHRQYGTFHGEISVLIPRNPLVRLFARLSGFPAATSAAVPFAFTCEKAKDKDVWIRRVGDNVMTSRLWQTSDGKLAEQIGAVTGVSVLVPTSSGGIALQLRRFCFFACPVPLALAPKVRTQEFGSKGKYCFDVSIRLPVFGAEFVRYTGHLRMLDLQT